MPCRTDVEPYGLREEADKVTRMLCTLLSKPIPDTKNVLVVRSSG